MRRCFANSTLRRTGALQVLLLAICCGRGEAHFAPPLVSGFSRMQAVAGSNVTLTFTGANFVPGSLNLMFSPVQGITVTSVRVVSSIQISAQVEISATAQLGGRQVILQDADHALKIATPFTITGAPQPNCSPGMAATACGSAPPATPALREFTPLLGSQGAMVLMTFTGVNFTAPVSLQFGPSSGVTVQLATLPNANQIQTQVGIAPNAALSTRGVGLVVGTDKKRLTAANTFTIVPGVSATHGPPIQILRVVPNQLAPGSQNVDLTLEGTSFVPGTQVTFTVGAGVPAAVFANGPAPADTASARDQSFPSWTTCHPHNYWDR